MQTHERPTLTRRGFLSGLAALPVAAAVAAPVLPAIAAPTPDMEALWLSYLMARHAQQAAEQAYKDAYAQLPWWAQSGPSFLQSDGTISGVVSTYPAIQDVPPEEGFSRLIRPTPHTIERDFDVRRNMMPDATRIEWRDAALASLQARQDAARAEHERLNVPVLSEAEDAATSAMFEIEDAITALEPASPAVIAMQIMVQTRIDAQSDASISDGCEMGIAALGLRGLLPVLTGEIATTAHDFLADRELRLDAMRLWRGIAPAVTV